MAGKKEKFILWFDEVGIKDVPLVGGKNASLGEMIRSLGGKGVKVPNGFAVTAYAYRYLLEHAGILDEIKQILSDLDTHDMHNLQERGKKVRKLIRNSEFPPELDEAIRKAYAEMPKKLGYEEEPDVAVRSSATAEDLPDASFAGQQETYLNIRGPDALIDSCKKCFASLFTDRAISYREDKGFNHFDVYLSIAVQKMVRSDAASSGVMFSIDTESGFKDAVFITSSYGLGENVVQGAVNPDDFYVFKPTLKEGKKPIIGKKLGTKKIKMIYAKKGTENVDVPEEEQNKFSISDEEVLKLGEWACVIEDHYEKPMDIEWAKNGDGKSLGTGELFIVQARPETVHSQRDVSMIRTFELKETGKVLVEGQSVGEMIGQGEVNSIELAEDIQKFKKGQVLVTDMTDPDWEPIMKIASAIVTNRGGRTCHAAIVSRELGIPCVVGTENGTDVLKTGNRVTVSCAVTRHNAQFIPPEILDRDREVPV
ncbi:MAG: phosphoenolpyruvate synthase, partial [Candidatus Altiarchaeota archaeon]|nr:phosphoenolpyruvate synthase [Candidatus Altiarchaeota archaeon]